MVVVEVLPLGQPLLKIDVAFVAEQLIELLLVGAMRALDFPVELRCARFDIDMADPLVGQMPVKQGLELMPAIRADGVNPERKLPHDVIDERDGVLLRVSAVDAQRADPRGVIDGRVLVAPQAPTGVVA